MASHIAKVYPKLESLSIFLVKHPSHQTEQAQTIVFLVLINNLERGRINSFIFDWQYTDKWWKILKSRAPRGKRFLVVESSVSLSCEQLKLFETLV